MNPDRHPTPDPRPKTILTAFSIYTGCFLLVVGVGVLVGPQMLTHAFATILFTGLLLVSTGAMLLYARKVPDAVTRLRNPL